MNIPILSNETITAERLDMALPFDTYHNPENNSIVKEVIDLLLDKISSLIDIPKKRRSLSRWREDALRQVVLNLYIGYWGSVPIHYSRAKTRYLHSKKYGKPWLKYRTLIPIIDALETLGYLETKIGFFDNKAEVGKQSRMWATKKFIDLFSNIQNCNFISKERPCEIIQLKDEQKKLIGYHETQKTDRMRKRLEGYNSLINDQTIIARIKKESFSLKFLRDLLCWIIDQSCEIVELKNFKKIISSPNIPIYNISISNLPISNNPITNNQTSNNNISNLPIPNITSLITKLVPLLGSFNHKYHNLHILSLFKSVINDVLNKHRHRHKHKKIVIYNIDKLFIKLNYIFLHRVFNNSKFFSGGRFYGSVHQQLPSAYRKHIFINDNPTIELDYSALHIRMLYHLEGVDFRKDPYEGIKERKKFKIVQLILINAKDRKKAVCGIRKELMEMGYRTGLKDEDIEELIETFVSLHPKISKFLHSGKGLKLQNIDSKIMDNILTNLTNMGIPALPVHDSVIVEKQYEEELKYQMVNCYKKEMNGFEPIIH